MTTVPLDSDYRSELIIKLRKSFSGDHTAERSVLACLPKTAHVQKPFDAWGFAVISVPVMANIRQIIEDIRRCNEVEFAETNDIDTGA